MNDSVPTTREVVLASGTTFAVDTFASDLDREGGIFPTLQNAAIDVIDKWCYSFGAGQNNVTGLGIKGVQAVAREMSKKGEIVKPVSIDVVAEDDTEIRIICTAVREVIQVIEGQVVRIELDRTTRAKRQMKEMEVNDYEGQGDQRRKVGTHLENDKFWYEKAVSKAVRNAMLPLLGGEAEATVRGLWREAQIMLGKNPRFLPPPRVMKQLQAPAASQAAAVPPQQQQPAQRPAQPAAPAQTRQQAQSAAEATLPDNAPVSTSIRQITNRKYMELKSSLGSKDWAEAQHELFRLFPETKPLQGDGFVLGKVQTMGKARELIRWLDDKIAGGSYEIDPGVADLGPGVGDDVAGQQQVRDAVMNDVCDHPEDQLQMSEAGEVVCQKCGQVVPVAGDDDGNGD